MHKQIIIVLFIGFVYVSSEELIVLDNKEGWAFGKYLIEEKEMYESCESGYYCPGNAKKYKCPDGMYSIYESDTCYKCGCKESECWKSDFINETTGIQYYAGQCKEKSLCKPGYGYDKEKNTCLKCNQYLYSKGGDDECERCPDNLVPNKERDGCEECPIGYVGKKGSCHSCFYGKYFNTQTKKCERCPDGYVQPERGQTECIKCPEGWYTDVEQRECSETKPEDPISFGVDVHRWKHRHRKGFPDDRYYY